MTHLPANEDCVREGALARHPLVAQCAVIAVPDDLREEKVYACIVLANDSGDRAAAARGIFEHARARLAYFKPPGWILFVSDLPKTPSQKMQKFAIFPNDVDPRALPDVFDMRTQKRRSTT